MTLTAEEIDRIRRGEPVNIDIPEVGTRCVLLRSDTLVRLIASEGDDITREALTELVDRVMAEEDAGDPLLAGYQSFRP